MLGSSASSASLALRRAPLTVCAPHFFRRSSLHFLCMQKACMQQCIAVRTHIHNDFKRFSPFIGQFRDTSCAALAVTFHDTKISRHHLYVSHPTLTPTPFSAFRSAGPDFSSDRAHFTVQITAFLSICVREDYYIVSI